LKIVRTFDTILDLNLLSSLSTLAALRQAQAHEVSV
jgi:hypothetical protein